MNERYNCMREDRTKDRQDRQTQHGSAFSRYPSRQEVALHHFMTQLTSAATATDNSHQISSAYQQNNTPPLLHVAVINGAQSIKVGHKETFNKRSRWILLLLKKHMQTERCWFKHAVVEHYV